MRSAIILAGGRGSRLGYREKALIDIGGRPLISQVIKRVSEVVDEVIVSVRDKKQGDILSPVIQSHRLAFDRVRDEGPLAGILAGLSIAGGDYCFIGACDMPFLEKKVIDHLFIKAEGFEAAVPEWKSGLLEPLHAVYRREAMLIETEKALVKGETVILSPISRLGRVNYVPVGELEIMDPGLKTFMNINTPEDLCSLEELLSYHH